MKNYNRITYTSQKAAKSIRTTKICEQNQTATQNENTSREKDGNAKGHDEE
jgi:hypothetical protein